MSSHAKKLVIVGCGGCGKSCLKNVFSTGIFSPLPRYESPIVSIEVDGDLVDLSLIYPQGGEDYQRLRSLSYVDADVVLVCFSVSYPKSLEDASEYAQEVKQTNKIPIVLVGNKNDLRNDDTTRKELARSEQEPVKTEEGRAMAEKIKAYAYLECTAKYNEGVREVFETATRAALLKGTRDRGHDCCGCVVL